jgi:hypothetical protein
MRTRFCLALAAALTLAAAAPAVATSGPTLSVSGPDTVHVGKTYRVHASGTAPKQLWLVVFVQTDWKCKKSPDGESEHHAYQVNMSYNGQYRPLVPVGPGAFDKRSEKLEDTKANGHDYLCAYLVRGGPEATSHTVVKRAHKRYASKQ